MYRNNLVNMYANKIPPRLPPIDPDRMRTSEVKKNDKIKPGMLNTKVVITSIHTIIHNK
jgi:hypothetical protein